MNVLSLFNGMNCIGLALHNLGIKANIYASEIDKHANKISDLLFPGTVNLGCVKSVSAKDLPKIDLIVFGSPCQGFSFAGKMLNFEDERSKLFFEAVRILEEAKAINPNILFLMENVRMKKEHEQVISKTLGIEPIMINSNLVSAQNRERLYWTNIGAKNGLFFDYCGIPQPEDKGIFLKDILEKEVDKKYFLSEKMILGLFKKNPNFTQIALETTRKSKCFTAGANSGGLHSDMDFIIQRPRDFNDGGIFDQKTTTLTSESWQQNNVVVQLNPSTESGGKQPYQHNRVYDIVYKSPCLDTDSGRKNILEYGNIRRLTPTECARLQTIPNWAIEKMINSGVSNTQLYKMFGNGMTIYVIEHFLKHIK